MTKNLISNSSKQHSVHAVLPPQWLNTESAFKGVNQLIFFVCNWGLELLPLELKSTKYILMVISFTFLLDLPI